jgi:hypothetical protein
MLMINRVLPMPMKHLRKIRATLRYGRLQKLAIHHGQPHGVQDVPDGTSNVLRWHTLT